MMFEKTIQFLTKSVSPEACRAMHADFARRELAKYKAVMPDADVITHVDGVKGASESSVKYGGIIRYDFLRLSRIATFALAEAHRLSPSRTGRYKGGWFFLVDGRHVTTIPAGTRKAILVNDQPYHRKLEMTVNQKHRTSTRIAPGILEAVRQSIFTKYATLSTSFDINIEFIALDGGYILKGGAAPRFASRTQVRKRENRTIIKDVTRLKDKKDRQAGAQMTYPALVIEALHG